MPERAGPPGPPAELADLLAAADAAAKDRAWAAFLECFTRLFLHVARKLGRDHDAAMDAYAFVLEELRRNDFRRLRTYSPLERTPFDAWLLVVTRRLCLDFARQRYGRERPAAPRRTAERAARRSLVDLVGRELDPSQVPNGHGPQADEAVQRSETLGELRAALTTLPHRDQLLLAFRFEQEMSASQIASLMGFPTPFHVYRRLNALLDTLRQLLARRGVDGVA